MSVCPVVGEGKGHGEGRERGGICKDLIVMSLI